KLEDRARPAVQQQQWAGGRPSAGHVQEMQIYTRERHLVLWGGVQPRFLGAPVEGVAPILHELPQVAEIGAVRPRVPWRLIGEAGAGEPVAQVRDCLVGNSQSERFRSCGHPNLASSQSAD